MVRDFLHLHTPAWRSERATLAGSSAPVAQLTLEGAGPQACELATNLEEFSFDLKSLRIGGSSEQAELFAQQLLHIE
jgi:hypothetical protein